MLCNDNEERNAICIWCLVGWFVGCLNTVIENFQLEFRFATHSNESTYQSSIELVAGAHSVFCIIFSSFSFFFPISSVCAWKTCSLIINRTWKSGPNITNAIQCIHIAYSINRVRCLYLYTNYSLTRWKPRYSSMHWIFYAPINSLLFPFFSLSLCLLKKEKERRKSVSKKRISLNALQQGRNERASRLRSTKWKMHAKVFFIFRATESYTDLSSSCHNSISNPWIHQVLSCRFFALLWSWTYFHRIITCE